MEKKAMLNITRNVLKATVLALLMLVAPVAMAQEESTIYAPATEEDVMDSIEISLVTCEPHSMIYALYGHTGIRIHDLATGEDLLANWGIFEQRKKFFILRFTFGLTDYRMDIENWQDFCERYDYFNCGIRVQPLNLTNREKRQILQAIYTNYLPENRYYRYNFFYDNCTTRARDIIVNNLDGKIDYDINPAVTTSYRDEIHQWNFGHLWARWGNDFLLGVGSDRKTDRNQQQFLPDTLRVDFDKAYIVSNGQRRKLVKSDEWATPSRYDWSEPSMSDLLTSPEALGIYLFLIMGIIGIIECMVIRRRLWQFDAFLLLLSGIPGIVLFAMIFSQHPTVSLNFQILVFNPLALVFGWKIIKNIRRGLHDMRMTFLAICAALAVVLSFWQEYADGVLLLALVLLIRFIYTPQLCRK